MATLVDMLAAIPTVILGLWGILVLGPFMKDTIEPALQSVFGFLPIFSGDPSAFGYLTAATILTIMATPIITSVTREVFETVPGDLKEASYALGATRWEMVRQVVLPYSRSGIVGATILGLGRAIGEAIAVAQVIGGATLINASLFHTGGTLAAQIAAQFQRQRRAAEGVARLPRADPAGLRGDRQRGRPRDRPARQDQGHRRDRDRGGGAVSANPHALLLDRGNLKRRNRFNRAVERRLDVRRPARGRRAPDRRRLGPAEGSRGAQLALPDDADGASSATPAEASPTRSSAARSWSRIAAVIAIPVGILVAIYTTEFAPPAIAHPVRFVLDILNGVPTIITGIFVFGLIVVPRATSRVDSPPRWRWRS